MAGGGEDCTVMLSAKRNVRKVWRQMRNGMMVTPRSSSRPPPRRVQSKGHLHWISSNHHKSTPALFLGSPICEDERRGGRGSDCRLATVAKITRLVEHAPIPQPAHSVPAPAHQAARVAVQLEGSAPGTATMGRPALRSGSGCPSWRLQRPFARGREGALREGPLRMTQQQ